MFRLLGVGVECALADGLASAGPGPYGCGDLHVGSDLNPFAKKPPSMCICLAQAGVLLCLKATDSTAVMPCREAKQKFTAAADVHRAQQQKVDSLLHQVMPCFPQFPGNSSQQLPALS